MHTPEWCSPHTVGGHRVGTCVVRMQSTGSEGGMHAVLEAAYSICLAFGVPEHSRALCVCCWYLTKFLDLSFRSESSLDGLQCLWWAPASKANHWTPSCFGAPLACQGECSYKPCQSHDASGRLFCCSRWDTGNWTQASHILHTSSVPVNHTPSPQVTHFKDTSESCPVFLTAAWLPHRDQEVDFQRALLEKSMQCVWLWMNSLSVHCKNQDFS